MLTKRRGDSDSDTTEIWPKDDALLVRFVELLSNEVVMEMLCNVLNPKALTDRLDTLMNGWVRKTRTLLLQNQDCPQWRLILTN